MKYISQIYSIALQVIYFISVIFYGFIFYGRNKKLELVSTPLTFLLLLIHAVHIVFRSIAIENIPLITKFDALSLLAFSIVSLNLLIQIIFRNKSTGFFTLILAFAIQSISSIFYNWNIIRSSLLNNSYYTLHVLLTIIG